MAAIDNNEIYSLFLAFGSNLGDKKNNIEAALEKTEKRIGRITSISAFYDSVPDGFESNNNFINSACEVVTSMNVFEVFSITQDIEKELGRSDKSFNQKYRDRVIDIDIIMAGNRVIDTANLIIPHPRFHERNFVLEPLCEIAPDAIHPVIGKTVKELRDLLNE